MFANVDALGGFGLPEIAFLYGATSIGVGLADLVVGNVERLGTRIRTGTLDAMMVRPVSLFAQVCADEFALRRTGRIPQARRRLRLGLAHVDVDWDPARVLMVPVMVAAGTVIFTALFTLGRALQFWTAESSRSPTRSPTAATRSPSSR